MLHRLPPELLDRNFEFTLLPLNRLQRLWDGEKSPIQGRELQQGHAQVEQLASSSRAFNGLISLLSPNSPISLSSGRQRPPVRDDRSVLSQAIDTFCQTGLTSLRLCCFTDGDSTPSFPTLPHLVTLDLSYKTISSTDWIRHLICHTLPSLQTLSLTPWWEAASMSSDLPADLVNQLQVLQLFRYTTSLALISRTLSDLCVPVLLVVHYGILDELLEAVPSWPDEFGLPPHLLLTSGTATGMPEDRSIQPLISVVSHPGVRLQSLHLPTSLLLSDIVRNGLNDLLDHCEASAVEVVWRGDEHEACDQGVSEAFRRYSRKIKLEEKAMDKAA
ncbi:hypothetical protein JCM11251_005687 [Rhodosporidiobolus azoricus]